MLFPAYAYCEEKSHVERVLYASAHANNFVEIRDGWVALGELSNNDNNNYRIDSYISLLDYYIGEGNHTYLNELIVKEGPNIHAELIEKYNMPINCKQKYSEICRTKEERNRVIKEIITSIVKNDT